MTVGDLILLTILWTSPMTYNYLIVAFVITVFFLIVIIWSFWGVYLFVAREQICHTNYFFLKKCFRIQNIDSIYYQPSWIVGEGARSLNIIDMSTGEQRHIGLPNLGFSEKTLADIARHLKRLNPSIELDKYAEALVNGRMEKKGQEKGPGTLIS